MIDHKITLLEKIRTEEARVAVKGSRLMGQRVNRFTQPSNHPVFQSSNLPTDL